MAMSLEELLAKEGFKRGKSKITARASFGGETTVRPVSARNDQRRPGSLGFKKTERTKSDIPRYELRSVMPSRGTVKGKKIKNERRDPQEMRPSKSYSIGSYEDLGGNDERARPPNNEIVEEVEESRMYSKVHSNMVYIPDESEEKLDTRKEKRKNKGQTLQKYKRNDKSFGSTSSNKSRTRKKEDIIQPIVDTPSLDIAAIQAMVSILSGYAKQFMKDENFRASHRESCFASLNVVQLEEHTLNEGKVLVNLEEAVETVERAAEERVSVRDLKKAALQLSVITGLNSDDLKDGFTCGLPNFKLSACAHFYLSVIYTLQKKDRISAKHLLQVFTDSPFQARTELLPDLWDRLFLPHLSDMIVWYENECDSMVNSPGKARRLKLVKKVYNEIMDSGTYMFAVYYKDWITEGVEAPVLPSIQTPSIPEKARADSPADSFLQVPMISKTLYDSVFRQTVKPESGLVGHEEESFDISARSSQDGAVEETPSSEMIKFMVRDTEPDASSFPNAQRSDVNNSPKKLDINDRFRIPEIRQEALESVTPNVLPAPDSSQLILSKLANAVFVLKHPYNRITSPPALELFAQEVVISNGLPEDSWSPESQESCRYFSEATSCIISIPKDFICPLTDSLFDDPVTIETGHTFESSAIKKWFAKGNRTCPVSGKTLDYCGVPFTNFILKRVITDWKLGHSKHLMDLASQVEGKVESKKKKAVFILEQLITASSQEERSKTTKELVSLGGLVFLLSRFEYGDLDEKIRILSLLLVCIHVDSDYRDLIATSIDKVSLLELLHSKHLKAKTNATLLLTELICLNRRKDAKNFLDGIQKQEISSAMHVLETYLQSCQPEQRPLLAVLLLHLDLLVEPQNHSVSRDEAVDAITIALERSLFDEMVCDKCCRALLILGGHFSFAGKIMTEDWILKQAGFLDGPEFASPDSKGAENINFMMEDVAEETARDKWLVNLSASLLGDGSKSFLEAIAQCLFSGKHQLVRVSLTTSAWLSSALVSLSEAEYQLSAFSALISGLKECLENGSLVEHKILASMSLLNFSKFPECRLLLMTMADDIASSLESLFEVTWTAEELYSRICSQ